MARIIRIPPDLANLAEGEAEAASRSLQAQIDHWARLGREVEKCLDHEWVLELKKGFRDNTSTIISTFGFVDVVEPKGVSSDTSKSTRSAKDKDPPGVKQLQQAMSRKDLDPRVFKQMQKALSEFYARMCEEGRRRALVTGLVEAIKSIDRKRIQDAIWAKSKKIYGVDPKHPGLIVQYSSNGRKKLGRMVGAKFVALKAARGK